MPTAPLSISTTHIRDFVAEAVCQAELEGTTTLITPEAIFGINSRAGTHWTERNGWRSLRTILFEKLGSESVRSGHAITRAAAAPDRWHEFSSRGNCIRTYLRATSPTSGTDDVPPLSVAIGPPNQPPVEAAPQH